MHQFGADPERTLMIGDTTHDLQLAANAGAPSVAVAYGAHAPAEFATHSPLKVVASVADLAAWLDAHA
jgi:phosphoglycolate phosphatase